MTRRQIIILLSCFILCIALFLRIYKLNDYLIFVYDQGRDAQAVAKILKGKLTLIGPTTGIPGLFYGPFYYYFIAFPYWLSQGNPLGVTIFLVLFDLLGIIICSLMVKEKNSYIEFFLCLILLTFTYGHISASRWLSNPNPILWLSPLFFYLLYLYLKVQKTLKIWRIELIYILGFVLGILFQTELANAIFFLPTIILSALFLKKKFSISDIVKFCLGTLIAVSPLIIFNFRHNFIITSSLKSFFANEVEKAAFFDILRQRPKYYLSILSFFLTSRKEKVLLLFCLLTIFYLIKVKFWKNKKLIILFLWLVTPLVLMLFYTSNKGDIWDYYLIGQPIPFVMIFSLALAYLINSYKKLGYLAVGFILIIFISLNIKEWRMLTSAEANRISFGNMKKTLDYIYQEAENKPFNLDIFVPNFLPNAYDYLFSWYGYKKYHYLPTFAYKN